MKKRNRLAGRIGSFPSFRSVRRRKNGFGTTCIRRNRNEGGGALSAAGGIPRRKGGCPCPTRCRPPVTATKSRARRRPNHAAGSIPVFRSPAAASPRRRSLYGPQPAQDRTSPHRLAVRAVAERRRDPHRLRLHARGALGRQEHRQPDSGRARHGHPQRRALHLGSHPPRGGAIRPQIRLGSRGSDSERSPIREAGRRDGRPASRNSTCVPAADADAAACGNCPHCRVRAD